MTPEHAAEIARDRDVDNYHGPDDSPEEITPLTPEQWASDMAEFMTCGGWHSPESVRGMVTRALEWTERADEPTETQFAKIQATAYLAELGAAVMECVKSHGLTLDHLEDAK